MPFPLAHPAAVLPLKRYCPRVLNFPALIIGSLVPDAGYGFGALQVENFSHDLRGLFGFSLPVGLLLVAGVYWLRARIVPVLPERLQRVLLPESWQPVGSPLSVVLSILLGSATHLFLDDFTHKDGWIVQRLPFLLASLGTFAGRSVRVCTLLWYGCSFIGVAWVTLAYNRRQRSSLPRRPRAFMTADLVMALGVALLVLPIELVHHLVHGQFGSILVAFFSGLLVLGAGLAIAAGSVAQRAKPPVGPERLR